LLSGPFLPATPSNVGKTASHKARKSHRTGVTPPRQLKTRVGTLTLQVPQDRDGTFSTQLFARYQRNEKALVLALMEMYVEGGCTRKVREITEVLCGTSFSKSLVSELAGQLDGELDAWRNRPLAETTYPYLSVDARYEHVRQGGRIVSQGNEVPALSQSPGLRATAGGAEFASGYPMIVVTPSPTPHHPPSQEHFTHHNLDMFISYCYPMGTVIPRCGSYQLD